MIKKYNMLLREEQEDLKAKIESKIDDVADEAGQTLGIYFYTRGIAIVGIHFSAYFSGDGTWVTTSLCKDTDEPKTIEEAREKAEEMFKAKDEWERLLVKIDEVLKIGEI